MSFTYWWRARKGNVQNALSSPPAGRAAASHFTRDHPGHTTSAATVAMSTKIATITWHSAVSASSTAASHRYRPVRNPASITPRNSTPNVRLSEKLNSPASVDVRLPPMMLPVPPWAGSRLNRNGTIAMANSGGAGNGRSASRANAYAATGSVSTPRTVTILNATP